VGLLDRFSRDEVSAKIWWPLALLGVIALALSFPIANRAADRTRADAAVEALRVSDATLQPLTSAGASTAEISQAARAIVAAEPTLSAVRVWDASHELMASSDPADRVGSAEALNDADIDRALVAGSTWVVADAAGGSSEPMYSAYTAIRGDGGDVVTQFEAADATLLADVHHDWMWFRIVVGAATLLLLALALLSMREPVARIGAGVPFSPENVPPWLRVMDVDREVALEQAGERARDRLANLQAKLDESERQRLRAEGELQQALTALGTKSPPPATLIVPDATPTTSPVASASPQSLRGAPTPDAAAAALAAQEEKKRARAAAAAEKQRAKAEAAAERAKAQAAAAAAAEAQAAAEAAAKAEADRRVAASLAAAADEQPPRPDQVSVRRDDVDVSVGANDTADAAADEWPQVVVVPEPKPAEVTAGASANSNGNHEARDVLERLVPETSDPRPADDVSDLRSRLARTAALKKPGSRERQDSRDDLPS
jgi:hypothetical protein